EQFAVADHFELDPVGLQRLARELGGEHRILRGLAAGSVGQKMHMLRNDIDQALVFAGEADAPDRGRNHLGPARGDGVEHELAVWIAGRPEEQARAEFAAGNDEGIGHFEYSSTALAGAHDLDAVARPKRRLRPSRPWNDGAIDGDRNSALAGVDCFFLQQRGERPRDEWLVLPVDT